MSKNGFTLLEMMIAVVIVGILSTIAIRKYIDYTAHAQMSETVVLAKNLAGEVLLNLQSGSCTSGTAKKNEQSGKYARVWISEGTVPWTDTAPKFPTNCYISVSFLSGDARVSKLLAGNSIGFSVLNNGDLQVSSYNGDLKKLIPKTLF